MELYHHERKIWCPHCGEEYNFEPCDGDGALVTYWGEGPAIERECSNEDCEKTFYVTEHVDRTFTTGLTDSRTLENEAAAHFTSKIPMEE